MKVSQAIENGFSIICRRDSLGTDVCSAYVLMLRATSGLFLRFEQTMLKPTLSLVPPILLQAPKGLLRA